MQILLLLFCLLHLNTPNHDIPIAIFRIQQNSENLTLDLSLDAEDLAKEINLPSAKITKFVLQQYLSANTTFLFNQQENNLKITDVKRSKDHFKIKAIFKTPVSTINNLEITNTCLLKTPKQSNIIQLDLNNTTKDFRMHQQRQKISVNY